MSRHGQNDRAQIQFCERQSGKAYCALNGPISLGAAIMELASVRALKAQLLESVSLLAAPRIAARFSGRNAFRGAPVRPPASIAYGVAPGSGPGQYRLAARIIGAANARAMTTAERVRKAAHGEADIRFVSRVRKRAAAWPQQRQRPLLIGASIAHIDVTAGTTGAFVTRRGGPKSGEVFVLSNNHVLANENRGSRGDLVLQQGPLDGGAAPVDRIGALSKLIKLDTKGKNAVDAALAAMEDGCEYYPNWLRGGRGNLAGVRAAPIEPGDRVWKIGRTTGLTRGVVTAIELDDVVVEFDIGDVTFDGQIEISGDGRDFSDGGDSGSLILDASAMACGLLFAGGFDEDGADLTYANPIGAVLDKLKVDLVF